MVAWTIDGRFDVEANADVMRFLRARMPSAHSDVADELVRAAADVPALHAYCPDTAAYAFFLLHRDDDTIVGLAWGQSGLAFRLPGERLEEALRDGGRVADELGPDWVRLVCWTDHETLAESRARLARWCRVAGQDPA